MYLKQMRTLSVLLFIALGNGCATQIKKNPEVKYAGALRNIMHKGDLSAKIDLSELNGRKNLFALGAFENLKGEVKIFDSIPYSTYVSERGKLKFDQSLNKKATLLVYSEVKSWKEYKIPRNVKTKSQFEEYLETQARKHGLDIQSAFPFLIEGKLEMNNWHVINWDLNDKIHTHRKHIKSGIHQKTMNTSVTMLGFYSQNHTGIYTHHTTNMHIHFVDEEREIAGHSDDMILGSEMVLKLPTL